MGKVISWEDFLSPRNQASKLDKLRARLEYFLACFEAVFGEADWEMTKDILGSPSAEHYRGFEPRLSP